MKSARKLGVQEYPGATAPVMQVREGGIAAYVIEATAFEALQNRLKLLEGLARGEKTIDEGKVVSHARAKRKLARWLK